MYDERERLYATASKSGWRYWIAQRKKNDTRENVHALRTSKLEEQNETMAFAVSADDAVRYDTDVVPVNAKQATIWNGQQ